MIKRKINETRIALSIALVVLIMSFCANPVPPSGGDKDTTSPVLISVESTIKNGENRIALLFNENITTSGSLVYSPKNTGVANPTTNSIKTQRSNLIITVPSTTNCLYLDHWVFDLNEKNPLLNTTLLLSSDSGELIIKIKGTKQTKEKYGVFIKKDSLIYLPQNKNNSHYHFQGLTNSIHETYIIKNDNNQKIDNNEPYQVFYSVNRPTDTFFITLYPERKIYKNAYFLRNQNMYCLIGSPVFHGWLNKTDSIAINQDTLFLTSTDKADIQQSLQIDSFIKTNKSIRKENIPLYGVYENDTIISTLGYYGFNHPNYSKHFQKNPFDTIKRNYLFLTQNDIKNPTDEMIYIKLLSEKINYILVLKPKETVSITLPEGTYSWVSWINNPYYPQLLNIEGYDFTEQKILDDPEQFFSSTTPWILKKNLSNTLILPEKTSYNTGVTTK